MKLRQKPFSAKLAKLAKKGKSASLNFAAAPLKGGGGEVRRACRELCHFATGAEGEELHATLQKLAAALPGCVDCGGILGAADCCPAKAGKVLPEQRGPIPHTTTCTKKELKT